MAVQNGKDLLIKLDLTGGGQFTTIAGLRATRISFNAETVDVTSLESQGGGESFSAARACVRPVSRGRACSWTARPTTGRGRSSLRVPSSGSR